MGLKLGQREILNFLQLNKGKMFRTKDIAKILNCPNMRSVVVCCQKLRKYGIVQSELTGNTHQKKERYYWV